MTRNLNERYEHVGSLGAGGMSTVYKARDKVLDRIVAIKQLRGELLSDEMVQRFEREARAYAALQHPNIISIFDFGTDENSKPFLVMDFIEGTSLDEVIACGALHPIVLLNIFIDLLEGLSHAHHKSIVHRDLKPANVMVAASGTALEIAKAEKPVTSVKLLDFGIAKFDDDAEEAFKTRAGTVIGSPLYMSPEQAEKSSAVDARSDLYSVGCMLFEALNGKPPFRGENALMTIFAHRTADVPSMSEALETYGDAKAEFESVILKALSKQPNDRYQSANEMRNDLVRVRESVSKIIAERENLAKRKQRIAMPKGLISGILAVGGVGGVIGITLLGASFIEKLADEEGKRETAKAPVRKVAEIPSIKGDQPDYWRDYSTEYKIKPGTSLRSFSGRQDLITLSLGANVPDISRHGPEVWERQEKMLDGLEFLPKLSELVIQNFTLTKENVLRFARLKNLNTIEFKFCKIPEGTLEILGTNRSFRRVGLKACERVNQAELSLLTPENFPALDSLDIATNNLNWKGSLTPLTRNPKLDYLDIQQTQITTAHLEALLKLKSLKRLNVGTNEFGDDAFKVFAQMPQLTELEVGYNKNISDAGVKCLAKLTNLEKLGLPWTQITESSLTVIAGLPRLKYLDVAGCPKLTSQARLQFKRKRPDVAIRDSAATLSIDQQKSFGTIYDK